MYSYMQLKRTKTLFLISLVGVALIMSCSSSPKLEETTSESSDVAPVETTIPADFEDFYERFHSDTNYQMAHIVFPLSGLPANADTLQAQDFKWQKDSWKWHRAMDETLSGYERSWQVISDEMISETIVQTSVGIGMTRRFAKVGGEWNLIYYAGMNPVGQ